MTETGTAVLERQMKCGDHGEKPSDRSAFGFYDHANSRSCAICGLVPGCHGERLTADDDHAVVQTDEKWKKRGYEPHAWTKKEDLGHDSYYCGCRGWD